MTRDQLATIPLNTRNQYGSFITVQCDRFVKAERCLTTVITSEIKMSFMRIIPYDYLPNITNSVVQAMFSTQMINTLRKHFIYIFAVATMTEYWRSNILLALYMYKTLGGALTMVCVYSTMTVVQKSRMNYSYSKIIFLWRSGVYTQNLQTQVV